jgi:TRAP-type mannitol/chloroaromatic compound transport system permease small subunit
MRKAAKSYVKLMDSISKATGEFAMFLVLALMGVLVFESVTRTVFNSPHIWAVEVSAFVMTTQYLIGGGYSLILKSHVRMDLFYHRLSERGQAIADMITFFPFMLFYLGLLLLGGIRGIQYALKFNQKSYTIWAPPMAPIKIIMVSGILLMLLQSIAELIKSIAIIRGKEIT